MRGSPHPRTYVFRERVEQTMTIYVYYYYYIKCASACDNVYILYVHNNIVYSDGVNVCILCPSPGRAAAKGRRRRGH